MDHTQLSWKPIAVLLALALIWGANWALVKIGARDLAPLFMAFVRSLGASVCLYIWMRGKGMVIFPSRIVLFHGVMVGLLFGLEFALVYVGLEYTLASRLYVLLYTSPFFAALGAHFLLPGDRLHLWKTAGLIVAFFGVVVLFADNLGGFSWATLPGDLLCLAAGAMWAATTLYIKKFLAYRAVPLQTLFYQVFFSVPLLFVLSLALENPMIKGFSWTAGFSMFYQTIIVAFLSFLVWFDMIHRYPVSLIHAFVFFTPIAGVVISGSIILGEPLTFNLLAALVLVSLGMALVNRRPRPRARQT